MSECIFNKSSNFNIDTNKKTIVFFLNGKEQDYTYIFGAAFSIRTMLKQQYNIITIGKKSGPDEENYIRINMGFTSTLKRAAECKNNVVENTKTIKNALKEYFKIVPSVDYCFIGSDELFMLPLTAYVAKNVNEELHKRFNAFHDYIGNDDKMYKDIDNINIKLCSNFEGRISPYAFSMYDKSISFAVIQYLHEFKALKKVFGLCIDPTSIYTGFFDKNNIDLVMLYFENDNRGTRNLIKFDIGQIQHIIYDKLFVNDWMFDSVVQDKNLIFAGTIFQIKGNRYKIWDKYLNGVTVDNSTYYIPTMKNGISRKPNINNAERNEKNQSLIRNVSDQFSRILDEVTNHKSYAGSIAPNNLLTEVKKYKYGLIFSCVSTDDSLNFRPVMYAHHNVLPLLDKEYDPMFLQIPKHLQDKLVVNNAQDINKLINYYNNNEVERQAIVDELRLLFKVKDYEERPIEMLTQEIQKIIPEFAE